MGRRRVGRTHWKGSPPSQRRGRPHQTCHRAEAAAAGVRAQCAVPFHLRVGEESRGRGRQRAGKAGSAGARGTGEQPRRGRERQGCCKALAAASFRRSASSTTTTRQRATVGMFAASWMAPRISSTVSTTPVVETHRMSGCVPAAALRHWSHSPQPPCGHTNAVAKTFAAMDRPEPGGPVNSHEWVIACGSSTALCSGRRTDSAVMRPKTPGASSAAVARVVAGVVSVMVTQCSYRQGQTRTGQTHPARDDVR